ncbi:hypothetical protein GUI37_01720 [Helcococcus kunzii]|uniref:hypothetical protein n=1 Tax=Helcococcus kunzii TaxID=40091 RepID=UPI001BB0740A|nr:hypothetical protein [Helcococcus kunzii]QUY63973.1 hypothetical protein GUI37_01720 [Helcococcus kunzii]
MKIDIDKIKILLDSDTTGYQISKNTGIQEIQISNLRNGKTKLENITVDTAKKLMKFIEENEMRNELLTKLKNYMDLYDTTIEEFVKNYDVTENIVNVKIDDELTENAEIIWATNEDKDYIIFKNGDIYSGDEIEILM